MKFKPTQDSILFIAGLVFLFHEVFLTGTAEPIIMAASCAMCGLPFVRARDR